MRERVFIAAVLVAVRMAVAQEPAVPESTPSSTTRAITTTAATTGPTTAEVLALEQLAKAKQALEKAQSDHAAAKERMEEVRKGVIAEVEGSKEYRTVREAMEKAQKDLEKARQSGAPQERLDAGSAYNKNKRTLEAMTPKAIAANKAVKETEEAAVAAGAQAKTAAEDVAAAEMAVAEAAIDRLITVRYDRFKNVTKIYSSRILIKHPSVTMNATLVASYPGEHQEKAIAIVSMVFGFEVTEKTFTGHPKDSLNMHVLVDGQRKTYRCNYTTLLTIGDRLSEVVTIEIPASEFATLVKSEKVEGKILTTEFACRRN